MLNLLWFAERGIPLITPKPIPFCKRVKPLPLYQRNHKLEIQSNPFFFPLHPCASAYAYRLQWKWKASNVICGPSIVFRITGTDKRHTISVDKKMNTLLKSEIQDSVNDTTGLLLKLKPSPRPPPPLPSPSPSRNERKWRLQG